MAADDRSSHVAYRAVLLAAGLLLFGLLFRQLVTLLLAILITIIFAIPLAAAADRLQRHRIPRAIGALVALLGGITVLALVIYLLIPPFVDQSEEFADDVPRIVVDLEETYADFTGEDPGEVGDRVQEFVERNTENPERLIGPITEIGLNGAGILAALVLILITAYYMAIRPEPLVGGLVSLFPPRRRDHVRHVLDRLRASWVGWMQGVAIDMLVTFVLLYLGLTIIGLDFAIFFAVLSALLVVVPYFGAIAGAIPPVLFAFTDSPGKALITLLVYLLVQQLESNVTIPVIMAQRTRMHPAMIAIGVVVVGQLFGFVGLFVAVPILSLLVISVEEFWVKPIEQAELERRRDAIERPSGELDDRDDGADQHEDHDQDLDHDPEAGQLHGRASTR
ncbi:MAG TPA: AI-2E family transporter [Thermoleophilaceae bacterium]|nr:AI-2E family transporter [Thermoleophilaceae bacterium]